MGEDETKKDSFSQTTPNTSASYFHGIVGRRLHQHKGRTSESKTPPHPAGYRLCEGPYHLRRRVCLVDLCSDRFHPGWNIYDQHLDDQHWTDWKRSEIYEK